MADFMLNVSGRSLNAEEVVLARIKLIFTTKKKHPETE